MPSRRMKSVSIFVTSALFLVACDRENGAENGPAPGPVNRDAAGYSKAWIRLKAQNLDPESHREQAEKIAAEFGYAFPNGPQDPALQERGPVEPLAKSGAIIPPEPVPLPPQRDFLVMSGRINSVFAHYVKVTVRNGETLKGSTVASADNYNPLEPDVPLPPADPFMIAFYQSSATADPNAYPIKVVGFNDDISSSNTNCAFSWTNNTGASKTVSVVSFVYSRETFGFTTAKVTVVSGSYGILKYQKERWISGHPSWAAKYPHTNSLYTNGPLGSKINMAKGTSMPYGTGFGFVAIDATSGTGGFMYDTEGTLALPSVWPQGYPNLYLEFCACNSYDENNPTYDYFFTELRDTYGLTVP